MQVLEKVAKALSRNYGITVRFQGSKAYTDYKTVTLPMLPDSLDKTNEVKVRGYCDHEIGHLLNTDPEVTQLAVSLSPEVRKMRGLLEDFRVERDIAAKYVGTGINMERTAQLLIKDPTDDGHPVHIMTKLWIEGRRKVNGYKLEAPDYETDIKAAFGADIFDRLRAMGSGKENSMDAVELAKQMVADYDSKDKNDDNGAEGEGKSDSKDKNDDEGRNDSDGAEGEDKNDDEGKNDGEDKNDAEDSDGDEGEDKNDSDGAEGDGKDELEDKDKDEGAEGDDKGDGDESDDEGVEGDDKGAEGDDESDGDGDDDGDDGDDDGDGELEDKGDESADDDEGDESDDEGDDEKADEAESADDDEAESDDEGNSSKGTDEGGDKGGDKDTPYDDNKVKQVVVPIESVKDDKLDDWKDQMDELQHEVERLSSDLLDDGVYLPYSKAYDKIVPIKDDGGISTFNEYKSQLGTLHSTRGKIAKLFLAQQISRWECDKEEGKINTRKLAAVRAGNRAVFKTKELTTGMDTAVTMLCDFSGSMSASGVEHVMAAVVLMLETLKLTKIKAEVLGFTTDGFIPGIQDLKYRYLEKALNKWTRIESIITLIIKSFNEPYNAKVKRRISNAVRVRRRNNCDADNLLVAYDRILAQPQPRKIIFVLSDGQPAGYGNNDKKHNQLIQVVKDIERSGVEIIGIGMGVDVSQYYSKHFELDGTSDVPQKMYVELKRLLNV